MSSGSFMFQNIISIASRERCMANLKKFRIPSVSKSKIDFNSVPTAAVLVPLCNINNSTSLLYTLRSANLKNYSGEVSFPGGKTDKGETPIATALRETEEEIGLSRDYVDVWGSGPLLPGRSYKILITPVIGSISNLKEKNILLNQNEVSEVFVIPLEILCDPKNQFYTRFENGYIFPVFLANGYKIWGLTAIITHVFLSSLLPKDVYSHKWTSTLKLHK